MLLADSHITMVVEGDVHVTTALPFNPIHPYMGMVSEVWRFRHRRGTHPVRVRPVGTWARG